MKDTTTPDKDNDKKVQHNRFVEKARELGCDEDENRFNATLKKTARTEPQKKNGKTPNCVRHPAG